MEVATYTETGYIVFVKHCVLLGSGLCRNSTFTLALRLHTTGTDAEAQRKQVIVELRTAISILIKVHRKLLDLEYGPLKHICQRNKRKDVNFSS